MTNHSTGTKYIATGLSSNMEDYMEAIAHLAEENKVVRVKDIAKYLDIKMPSVSSALNKLKEMNLIDYEKYGYIELTKKGKEIADNICKRHVCLSEFFETVLSLDSETADTEACKAEHDLSPEAFHKLHIFLDFWKEEEKDSKEWITRLRKRLNS